ncbi:hypothetical protein L2E82_17037 [Cichorium intybus]|uniref:Uncharacterized protein n=1 Tax=Cichorium intybus TaxID=13427 RepID=A0ACB9F7M3_CICIN|nr:hypothetical protein L2E82_17037 [Cichorium intybus]
MKRKVQERSTCFRIASIRLGFWFEGNLKKSRLEAGLCRRTIDRCDDRRYRKNLGASAHSITGLCLGKTLAMLIEKNGKASSAPIEQTDTDVVRWCSVQSIDDDRGRNQASSTTVIHP